MKRRFSLLALLVAVVSLFSVAIVNSQSNRQVWAFYMGFWVGGDSWNWQADVMDDYPAIGPYDSRDPGVGGTQIDQAKSAGIDAFVVSWYGIQDGGTTTPVLNNLLDRAEERGFQVGAALDIFSDQFLRDRQSIIDSLNWLIYQRAGHPAYLRVDGKPVITFVFQGRAGFSAEEWQSIRNQVDPDRNTIWIAEGTSGCCIYGGAMDGMYAFNLAWANGSSGRYSSERRSALNAGGSLYVPMVHPGWDETKIAAREGRGNPTSVRNRNNGQFLANSFNGAVASGADIIMIGTWNEFVENSHIEPSQLYGTQSLDTLRPLVANWKGSAPPVDNSAAAPAQAPAPGTPSLSATTTLNVRPQPNTDGDPIGQIAAGAPYAIVGEQNGWYAINYNGQTGWVSGTYVNVENVTTTNGAPPSATSGRVAVIGNNVNVRSAASTDGQKLGVAPIGSAYSVLNQADGWVQIDFGGQAGWVLGDYVTIEDR